MVLVEYLLYTLLVTGILLTILGFILYFLNKIDKKETLLSLLKEAQINYDKAKINQRFYEKNMLESYEIFHTIAYEQFKQKIRAEEINREFYESLIEGYIFAEEFNKRIRYPEGFEEIINEKCILDIIKKDMKIVFKNLEKMLNRKIY